MKDWKASETVMSSVAPMRSVVAAQIRDYQVTVKVKTTVPQAKGKRCSLS
jgi:hypothetical protein